MAVCATIWRASTGALVASRRVAPVRRLPTRPTRITGMRENRHRRAGHEAYGPLSRDQPVHPEGECGVESENFFSEPRRCLRAVSYQ
jgi:hypothetical protein